jgi:carbonic anhydrase
MKKVFHFESQRDHYRCDAAVIWCFDNRFDLGFRKFLKRIGVENPDSIKIAGGARVLASPEQPSDREFILDQIRKSIRLHQTQRVILMLHSDCGAYGGLEKFRGDTAAEAKHHQQELQRAAEVLRRAIPGIEVQGYFIDFGAVWEVQIGPAQNQNKNSSVPTLADI